MRITLWQLFRRWALWQAERQGVARRAFRMHWAGGKKDLGRKAAERPSRPCRSVAETNDGNGAWHEALHCDADSSPRLHQVDTARRDENVGSATARLGRGKWRGHHMPPDERHLRQDRGGGGPRRTELRSAGIRNHTFLALDRSNEPLARKLSCGPDFIQVRLDRELRQKSGTPGRVESL